MNAGATLYTVFAFSKDFGFSSVGYLLLLVNLGGFVGAFLSSRIIKRFGSNQVLKTSVLACLLAIACLGLFSFPAGMPGSLSVMLFLLTWVT
jgi:uncharacterized membrane protein YfcA